MKKLFLFIAVVLFASTYSKANDAYTINDNQLESVFNAATFVPITSIADLSGVNMNVNLSNASNAAVSDKNAAVAFILAFFLGGLGIHRLYMGTKTMTWVGYILTCGGIFGIVPFVDWILLLIGLVNGGEISKYVDNPKFFMW